MALIDCPECGREVSNRAAACPECAFPFSTNTPASSRRVADEPPPPPWWKTTAPLAARLITGFILFGVGMEEGEATGIVAAVIIGGSAVPAWYRGKLERLRAGRSASVLDDRFEDRMAEIELRHQEQMDSLERMHSAQIGDLEERIEFTERLLTKPREQDPPS